MNRRQFLASGASAALVTSWQPGRNPIHSGIAGAGSLEAILGETQSERNALGRHRFGVNYTPSSNWWFCWNEWDPDPIQRDLDAISALRADHLRIMLIWPSFQPNLTWVSTAHLEAIEPTARPHGRARPRCSGHRVYRAAKRMVLSAAFQQA